MRKKYYWLISVVVIGVVAIVVTASKEREKNINWQKKYPQLVNHVGYSKLVDSVPPYKSKTASQQELIGKVTNQFGIRDDVLKLILTSIPESNVQATIDAIKMAQYFQQQIGVTDDKQMNLLANKASAAMSCINLPMARSYQLIQDYDKIIRDTPARRSEQN